MLSATTKMELRVKFAVRMCEVFGEDCLTDTNGDYRWLEIMREFMAGNLIKIRRIEEGGGKFRFEINAI